MLKHVFKKIIRLIEDNQTLFTQAYELNVLSTANSDYSSYKHIDFYAIDAEACIVHKLQRMEYYLGAMNTLATTLHTRSESNSVTLAVISEISEIEGLLTAKQKKLVQQQSKIPQGMLDVKRALLISKASRISHVNKEETALKQQCETLQLFMRELNVHYTSIIKEGGNLYFVLEKITGLYWKKLHEYTARLRQLRHDLTCSTHLTNEGLLLKTCITRAHDILPAERSTNKELKRLAAPGTSCAQKRELLGLIGFSSTTGIDACIHLSHRKKRFFHMPNNEDMYHFDYDPTEDLADTGGYCFGESILFIHSLSLGKFKGFCPEPALINYQLDQTRELKFDKITLGQAETIVSEQSYHQTLQWVDVKHLFLDNPNFNPGDICGIHFSMNDYTKSKRDFTAGHIAVVAKLDTSLSPYKYVVFEKEFGVFGLEDDESLEYILSKTLFPLYEQMHYSKIRLVKYGEATPETYSLIGSIRPTSSRLPRPLATCKNLAYKRDSSIVSPQFFQTQSADILDRGATKDNTATHLLRR